jgi:hypothetical protein
MDAHVLTRGRTLAFILPIAVILVATIHLALASAQRATGVVIEDCGAIVGGPVAAAALDDALHEALETQPGVRIEGRADHARYVVTGSIVEWDAREVVDGHEFLCGVSIVVADAHGAVRAMLSGRAAARGEGDLEALSSRALLAATRSALRPLGEGEIR